MSVCNHAIASSSGTCFICEPSTGQDDLTDAEFLEISRGVCTESLAEFFFHSWHVLEPSTPLAWNWHVDVIAAHIQAVIEDWAKRQDDPSFVQRFKNLVISQPPGTLKSRMGVVAIPWAWLRWPHLRAICLSANPRVALRDSMYAREILASEWYQETFKPEWKISASQDAKGQFDNTAGGYRAAISMDARIVGQRSDLIFVDDPHDPEESQSDLQRTSVIERWHTSIANRVNDLGSSVRIGVAQRVHESDWTASVLAEGDWAHLRLPLLFEADDPCTTPLPWTDPRTDEGQCLHPERFPPEVVEAERKRLGGLKFATLNQQRPAPAGGSMIKRSWYRYYRQPGAECGAATRPKGCWAGPSVQLPESFDEICLSADLAMKKGPKTDFNVIHAWARCGANYYLLASWRARADFPEVLAAFTAMAARFPLSRKIIEAAASGHALAQVLQGKISGVTTLPCQGTKIQRVQAVLPAIESGNVYLSEDWNQLEEFLAESDVFSNGRHDDQLDAMSLGLSQLIAPALDEEYEESRQRTIDMFLCGRDDPRKADRIAALRAWLEDPNAKHGYRWRAADQLQLGPIEPEPTKSAAKKPRRERDLGNGWFELGVRF